MTTPPTADALRDALRAIADPASGKDIVTAGLIEGIELRGGLVQVALLTDRAHAAGDGTGAPRGGDAAGAPARHHQRDRSADRAQGSRAGRSGGRAWPRARAEAACCCRR